MKLLAGLLVALAACPAAAQEVRIGLLTSSSAVRVTSAAPFNVTGLAPCQDMTLVPFGTGWIALVGAGAPRAYAIANCTLTGGASFNVTDLANGTSGIYRGKLETRFGAQGVTVIDILGIDDYLQGVVPSEVPASFPPEALKAMAVVARTYTLSHLGHHSAEGYDLCSSTHCQVYRGQGQEAPSTTAAVVETRGQWLSANGKPIEASFSACCGGHSVAREVAWPDRGAVPCLVGAWDEPEGAPHPDLTNEEQFRAWLTAPPLGFCQAATRSRWTVSFTRKELQDRLGQSLHGFVTLTNVTVRRRDDSGRVADLELLTDTGPIVLHEDAVRWITSGGHPGPGGLNSSLFWVEESPENIVFHGAGWGHGVGLCQEGAAGRALAGQSYRDIMAHYYPGSTLEGVPPLPTQALP